MSKRTILILTAEIFQKELERRNLQQQECCITLNWYLTIADEQEDIITERLKLWVEAWSDLVCEYFSSAVPDKAILIHALCLKVTTQKMSELVQKKVNRVLRNSRDNQPCNKQYLFLKSPLGVLDADEINDFFYENNFWRENLQLDQQNINLSDFSDWVCDKTKGEFEQTTTLIWQQYQQNYSRYKEDNHE